MSAPAEPGPEPQYVPVGDHGLLVEFGAEISDELSDVVLHAVEAIDGTQIPGLIEIVPAFVNLMVVFDPLVTDHAQMQAAIESTLGETAERQRLRRGTDRTIEVCYHATLATDLEAVAEQTGLTTRGVVERHLSGDYRLCMYGFNPGYAYLSGVPPEIQVPRKAEAVRDVAASSVIIAGPQSLVTTLTMPTGWHVLGRSPTPILQDDPDDPVRFALGDRIRFVEIDLATYQRRIEAS